MSTEYIVIFQQVIGSPGSGYAIDYASDLVRHATREAAISHGFKTRGSDDFNIGTITEDRLDGFYWMDKPCDDDLQKIADHLAIDCVRPR
jgi:hypothetical protein